MVDRNSIVNNFENSVTLHFVVCLRLPFPFRSRVQTIKLSYFCRFASTCNGTRRRLALVQTADSAATEISGLPYSPSFRSTESRDVDLCPRYRRVARSDARRFPANAVGFRLPGERVQLQTVTRPHKSAFVGSRVARAGSRLLRRVRLGPGSLNP